MADDRLRILEERLTRLEAALAQRPGTGSGGGFTPPGGIIVDSAPWASRFEPAISSTTRSVHPHHQRRARTTRCVGRNGEETNRDAKETARLAVSRRCDCR